MKNIFLALLFFLGALLAYSYLYKPDSTVKSIVEKIKPIPTERNNAKDIAEIISQKCTALQDYAAKNNYDTSLGFLIDMNLPSGRNRFFVCDLSSGKVLASGLVAHGQGRTLQAEAVFSNEPSSYCSSEGIYSVGASYLGTFGLAYKLHGLSETNSNAFKRFVVLHAHECVPDEEVYPDGICQSLGCPTVSPAFLQILRKHISGSDKKILLEIRKLAS